MITRRTCWEIFWEDFDWEVFCRLEKLDCRYTAHADWVTKCRFRGGNIVFLTKPVTFLLRTLAVDRRFQVEPNKAFLQSSTPTNRRVSRIAFAIFYWIFYVTELHQKKKKKNAPQLHERAEIGTQDCGYPIIQYRERFIVTSALRTTVRRTITWNSDERRKRSRPKKCYIPVAVG